MSWTIDQTGNNEAELAKLKIQLDAAANEDKIVMYCAGRDGGNNEPKTGPYPAAGCSNVKRVGSSDPYGRRSVWTNEDNVDFLLPGESILEGQIKGSSAATALMAGLAAFVLWCFAVTKSDMSQISQPDKLNGMLQAYFPSPESKYLNVSTIINGAKVIEEKYNKAEHKRLMAAGKVLTYSPMCPVLAFVKECERKIDS
jgi:hypothetical protein